MDAFRPSALFPNLCALVLATYAYPYVKITTGDVANPYADTPMSEASATLSRRMNPAQNLTLVDYFPDIEGLPRVPPVWPPRGPEVRPQEEVSGQPSLRAHEELPPEPDLLAPNDPYLLVPSTPSLHAPDLLAHEESPPGQISAAHGEPPPAQGLLADDILALEHDVHVDISDYGAPGQPRFGVTYQHDVKLTSVTRYVGIFIHGANHNWDPFIAAGTLFTDQEPATDPILAALINDARVQGIVLHINIAVSSHEPNYAAALTIYLEQTFQNFEIRSQFYPDGDPEKRWYLAMHQRNYDEIEMVEVSSSSDEGSLYEPSSSSDEDPMQDDSPEPQPQPEASVHSMIGDTPEPQARPESSINSMQGDTPEPPGRECPAAGPDCSQAGTGGSWSVQRLPVKGNQPTYEHTGPIHLPGTTQPGTSQPGASPPGISQEGTFPQPGTSSQPGNSQPGNSQPGTSQVGTFPQPGNSQPGNSQPGTAQAGTFQPDTFPPVTPQPGTSQPQQPQ